MSETRMGCVGNLSLGFFQEMTTKNGDRLDLRTDVHTHNCMKSVSSSLCNSQNSKLVRSGSVFAPP